MDKSSSIGDHLEQAQQLYRQFIIRFESVILATVNEVGEPLASYSPFVVDEDKHFYIHVSDLALHTVNIHHNKNVNLLFIDDEHTSTNIFARCRLNFNCKARKLTNDDEDCQIATALYQQRFGDIFELTRSFSDFQMIKLTPYSGRLVMGFGKAYELTGAKLDALVHITS